MAYTSPKRSITFKQNDIAHARKVVSWASGLDRPHTLAAEDKGCVVGEMLKF
jgi:hypothetical protein